MTDISTKREKHVRLWDKEGNNAFFFFVEIAAYLKVASVPNSSLASLQLLSPSTFLLSTNLRYFLDLKTPGSTGSDAAHQMYNPKTQVIWKELMY